MKSSSTDVRLSAASLSREITDYVVQRTEAVVARFLPDFVIPGFFCGYRRAKISEGPDLIYLLGHLHSLGVTEIRDVPIREAIVKLLRCVDGATTDTFYSYRVAETLLSFGKFEGNPLLAEFSGAEIENIRIATDSTQIYDPSTNALRGIYANNFWAVLARCEFARQQLGILEDDTVLKRSVEHLERWLFQNPVGFFDDGREGNSRYDIYSGDSHLFCEPIWHLLDPRKLEVNLRSHVHLLEKIGMENGASFIYGRSTGALSICLMVEIIAMSIERGLATDPSRSLGLVKNGFEKFQGWIEDDLINAHRHGNTEAYRGIHRVMQMTFDCLGKLCYTAEKLRQAEAGTAVGEQRTLFPQIDEFIPYDAHTAGVWMFRNDQLSFQLALVGGENADYVPWLRSPGLFENPVGSTMLCGVPRVTRDGSEYSTHGIPTKLEKGDATFAITHDEFKCVSDVKAAPLHGKRTASYRVQGDTIFWEEKLIFDEAPEALAYCIPETARSLRLVVSSDQPLRQDVVVIRGMAEWRSCWGGFEKLHQIQIKPACEVRISFEMTPKIRLRTVPVTKHDYMRSLYGAMSPDYFVEKEWSQDIGMNAAAMAADVDIVHVSWPEHLFGHPTPKEMEAFDAKNVEFIQDLGRRDVRIVWTMHNRRPHGWDEARGRKLYEAWAAIADGVIHHSEWGMNLVRAELPFRPDATHVVIPHGHFGECRRPTRSRKEIETSLGLPPCAMRFGLTGGWRKDKQIEMIMAAFTKAGRPEQQLVVTAYTPEMKKPDDPRIIFLPRGQWMSQEEVTDNTHLCDALVSAHVGDGSYLTSGISADAIGAGIPMFVPHWEYFHETLGDAPFYHDNTLDSLAKAFASITEKDLDRGKAEFRRLQKTFAWPALAAKTLAFYRSLKKGAQKD